jgi:CubicO group peptidase (beta-lactamase class C family)
LTIRAAAIATATVRRRADSAVADRTDEAIAGLDDYCRRAIRDWRVPGLALAIVRNGRVLAARGYGVRQLGVNAPIDANTIFPIASCTKAFTAAVIGKCVDQGKLRWDDPIGDYVAAFRKPNDGRNSPITIRQALQHRTGLPNANMLWRSGQFRADEILSRLSRLEPVAPPGERMIYNNVMYLAAAKAAEQVRGKSWSRLIAEDFLEPLSMTSSLSDGSRLSQFQNVAAPHATVDGRVQVIERHSPDVVAPAGSIHSSAADMAAWLLLHLNRGAWMGRELLSPSRIDEMQSPVEDRASERSAQDIPKAPISRYGMGWFVNEHAGRTAVEHSGSNNGFLAWMALMPSESLGLVILSNHRQTGVNSALRSWILDRLLNQPDRDWSSEVRKEYEGGWIRLLREARERFEDDHASTSPPSRPLSEYAGTYESALYGAIDVTEQRGRLSLQFGTRFEGEMKHWDGDSFRVFFKNPGHDDWLVTFDLEGDRLTSLGAREAPWAPDWYDDRDDLGDFRRQR